MTWFISQKWRVRKQTYIQLTLGFLLLSLFFERYCFVTVVYKTKYYGYVLILFTIALNCIFNLILFRLRQKPIRKQLSELFEIERTPEVNNCVIGLIGLLDMFYAFFLFWPANVIPIWMLIVLLQLFVPFNMLVRSACIGLTHYKVHSIAGFIIFIAVALSFGNFATSYYQSSATPYLLYSLLFLACSVFDSMSHALKESVVRSQPLDQ